MDVIEHKRVNPNASEYQRVIWELESVISEKKGDIAYIILGLFSD